MAAGGPGLGHRLAARDIRRDRFRPDLLHGKHALPDPAGGGYVLGDGPHVRWADGLERVDLPPRRVLLGERADVAEHLSAGHHTRNNAGHHAGDDTSHHAGHNPRDHTSNDTRDHSRHHAGDDTSHHAGHNPRYDTSNNPGHDTRDHSRHHPGDHAGIDLSRVRGRDSLGPTIREWSFARN
jgi:hypothetical protein